MTTGRPLSRRFALGAGLLALAAGGAVLAPAAARATSQARLPPELAPLWPTARLQGEGRLRFLGLHVYDARLWTPDGPVGDADWAQREFALELQYARALVGRQIAERSLQEIRRAGPLSAADAARWLEAMTKLFPDVGAGDRLTGVNASGEAARFFLNGRTLGEVREPAFAHRFFGIWLAPQTSQPQLRTALLGLG